MHETDHLYGLISHSSLSSSALQPWVGLGLLLISHYLQGYDVSLTCDCEGL